MALRWTFDRCGCKVDNVIDGHEITSDLLILSLQRESTDTQLVMMSTDDV